MNGNIQTSPATLKEKREKIMAIMDNLKKLLIRPLQLLFKQPIIEFREDATEFNMGEKCNMPEYKMLAVVKAIDIIEQNNQLSLNPTVSHITLFKNDTKVYEMLKTVYSKSVIVIVTLNINEPIVLNMLSYQSVKDTYDILCKTGNIPKNDKELINFATNKMIPKKKLVIRQASMGQTAFKGSSVKQYTVNYTTCYDMNLIIDITRYKENKNLHNKNNNQI